MNDKDRAQWIDNDEGLYNLWRSYPRARYMSDERHKRNFIRENRARIDEAIRNVTTGRKPAHYLAYGE